MITANWLAFPELLYRRFSHYLVLLWEKGQWKMASFLAAIVAYLTALLICFPGTLLHRPFYHMRMFDTLNLSTNVLARDLCEDITAYRLTVPILAKLLWIKSPVLIVLLFQILPSIATLALLFANAARRLGPRQAWPVTLMFALSFLLFWTFYYGGIFDSMTHLCLVLVMTTANPWLGFGIAVAGVMNDERFIIAAPFAVLWHYRGGRIEDLMKKLWKPALGLSIGIGASLGLRYALTNGFVGPGIPKPQVYQQIWTDSIMLMRPYATKSFFIGWTVFALSLFMSFRWLWIPFIEFFRMRHERYFRGFKHFFIGTFLLAVLSTAVVMDMAKSIGFLFPAVFFCTVTWVEVKGQSIMPVLWKLVGGLMITPVFCINGNVPAFWLPIPVEALRLLLIGLWDYDVIRDLILPLVHSDSILPPIRIYQ